jgi:hypothetical protein
MVQHKRKTKTSMVQHKRKTKTSMVQHKRKTEQAWYNTSVKQNKHGTTQA